MEYNFVKEQTCCFTGYRESKYPLNDRTVRRSIFIKLLKEIYTAIDDGYNTFLYGGASGFDVLSAQAVIYAGKSIGDIVLVCVLPYKTFPESRYFDDHWRPKLFKVLEQSNKIIMNDQSHTPQCFQKRNIFMVDNSSRVIALFNGKFGGTKNTLTYAKQKNVEIKNLLNYEII